jgi:hypothetical protein
MMKKVTFPDIRAYIRVIDNSWLDYASDILCVKFELFLINFSEFQNEKNIRYRFKIDGPMAFDQHGQIRETDYKKLEVLSFGEPASSKIEIFGNFGMLREERSVNLNIVFHGESSPSKITTYKLRIVPYNFRGVLLEGKAFLEINNSFLSEHQKNLGISHEESLKKSLGLEF